MMLRNLFYLVFPTFFTSCQKEVAVPLPEVEWDLFHSPDAVPLAGTVHQRMEGVYAVTEGNEIFGDQVVLKWSGLRNGSDTAFHVSIFCEKNIAYITGEGRTLNGSILLNNYWRTLSNTETGACWLQMAASEGADLLANGAPIAENSIIIRGQFGATGETPSRPIALRYLRPLPPENGFLVLAHRGGGRNADQLPASENSIEIIRMAERFGAMGIEIDVKLTSDGVPVLYHDDDLNSRLIQDVGLYGPINEYSHAQLDAMVRLVNGEKIPSLRDALNVVVNETGLAYVWLDVKYEGSLAPIQALRSEYAQLAGALGRDLTILIGLPGDEQIARFKELPGYLDIPSLNEVSVEKVRETNSNVWGPAWVSGQQADLVSVMHAEDRKVFMWTMDLPEYISLYMYGGDLDGILSNFPTLVAYYHYARP